MTARIQTADRFDRDTLRFIRQHGYSWIYVSDAACDVCARGASSPDRPPHTHDDEPPFAYTVGLALTAKAPELVVAGLSLQVAGAMVANYAARVAQGEHVHPRREYPEFANVPVQFLPLHAAGKRRLGQAGNIHHGWRFPALQLIYPDAEGCWPWDPACAAKTRRAQQGFCRFPPHD